MKVFASSTSIHGDRLQNQREQALRDFKNGIRNILSRGLDVARVNYVVNYDLPTDIEEHVHRVGRTGRVGNVGKSIRFFEEERVAGAGELVCLLTKSNADVPPLMQAIVPGMTRLS
ncbi:uncharacterized protein LOC130694111 [Daphnia carinata]|uniref:uncharacterized protein LOC130694111 n=1 Tax=Daphnia carinata TaxID=120202 RepID=UPI002868D16C|nr:uncharacterized protein LOC130694111 [Daphnia carinata]